MKKSDFLMAQEAGMWRLPVWLVSRLLKNIKNLTDKYQTCQVDYTSFEYSELKVSEEQNLVTVCLNVENTHIGGVIKEGFARFLVKTANK